MNKIAEIKPPTYGCEFCHREFKRASTELSHICEGKHRWVERDKKPSRIGFQTWLQFYARNSASKKNRTFEEFIKSAYYTAFVKFGAYCVNVNVLNVSRYADWLLKEQIKIDTWCQDSNYNKFLISYLRVEDPFDALARSIEHTITLTEPENIQPSDCLRYISPNKICYAVTMGKISPWMLFQSSSGVEFLSSLNGDHVAIISPYINPEQWAIKFNRDPEIAGQVKDLLKQAGY